MNVVELKDSDSSDNDIFIIKQIKPVNKITLPEALIIKYGVLNSFNSKKNKKKRKKDKIKCSIDSNEKQSKKIKNLSALNGSQKQLSKSAININTKNEDQTFSRNTEFFSEYLKKSSANNEEKIICYSDKLENVQEAKSSKVSNFINGYKKRTIDELSPEIPKERKKCKLNVSATETITLIKDKKPLNKLLNIIENNTFSVKIKLENDILNLTKEPNSEFPSDVHKNNTPMKSIKLEKNLNIGEENLDINKDNFIKNESSLGEFFSSNEFQFQNNLGDISADTSIEKNVEKLVGNSELLTFLLKEIISNETKKQIYLEKQSLKSGKKIEKLLSKSECKVLEKFFNLEHNACQVFVRMLGRKKDWHRISSINYKDIGGDLEAEFKILHKENFVDINIDNEDIKTQMHLLSKPELLKLCRALNVFLKSRGTCKKEILINMLLEDSQKQKSVLDMFKKKKCMSRLNILKSEIKNILGLCVRINNRVFQIFHKILLLYSFAHYYEEEEEKRFRSELFLYFQVYKGMIKFPNYVLCPTVVFETRTDFEEYEKSLLLQDTFETAISNKNYETFVLAFNIAKEKFIDLLKNHEYQQRFLNLKPFLKKFSAGTVYARILTKFCKTFRKRTDNLEVMTVAQLLLNQDLFLIGKRGEWYEILSKVLEILKQNNAAAEIIIKSLNDPHINEVQKLNLQLRGQCILKKKTCVINDHTLREVLDDLCTISVQEPPSIEIKGKALGENKSGFKSIYVQDFQYGKMFSSVEERAISYYKSHGFTRGYHVEGCIVQTIYFILFFDVIYGLSPEGVFQTPYQEAPLDLYSSSFYLNRKEDIDLLLNDMLVWDDKQIETKIKDVYYKNYYANCAIKWNDEFTPELFCEVIKCITMPILVHIFQRFVKNLRVSRSGFPDLTLWNPETNKCKFVEVKSPNDKLSPAQRIWLDYLRNIGLDCEVCNVKNISSKSCG